MVEGCRLVKEKLACFLKEQKNAELLGPAPLSVARINNRYRYRVMVRCTADSYVRRSIAETVMECSTDKRFRGVFFYADNDPED